MKDELKLYRIRKELKEAMQEAIACRTKSQKRVLAAKWKAKFSPEKYDEFIRIARDREARLRIAEWDLDNFDKGRHTKWSAD